MHARALRSQLLLALKEAKQLDERCTAREVTSFFVMVNADDEVYLPAPGTKPADRNRGAAELDYDEFVEIVCRICREKLLPPGATSTSPCPPASDSPSGHGAGSAEQAEEEAAVPFEQTLDTWLGLVFVPALRNAGKGILLEAAPRRK